MVTRRPALPPAPEDDRVIEGQVVPRPNPSVAATLRAAVTHRHSQLAARHAAYIGVGIIVAARRTWDSKTTAVYDRNIRAAEAARDQEKALEWEERRARFVKDRHARRMGWLEGTGKAVKMAPKAALVAFCSFLAVGVAEAADTGNVRDIAAPFEFTARLVTTAVLVASVAWGWAFTAGTAAFIGWLWWTGRRHASTLSAGWIAAPAEEGEEGGAIVTADTIVLALQHLAGAELKKAFKDGWQPTFTLTPVRDRGGYSAIFSLPLGVTPQMIIDQRPVFARNLHRAEIEVWATDAERAGAGKAGYVALWVADPGILDKPAPEYPLLHEGTADVFRGVPGGVTTRGDETLIPVVGNNFVAGGMMGQGKSNACRVVMLGAALDPLPELWVHVLAHNGDFDAYQPRLARYVKGADDEQVAAAIATLEECYADVGRREARLAELGAKKVTRGLAEKYPELRPRVVLFSECHEMFGHPEFGELATELAVKVLRRARKTAVTLLFDTQSSRKDAIPPKVVELVSVNVCFAVKSWRSNDGFLGDGSFQAGIRATELRPGRDRGRSLITGVSDAQFELLKWYFVEVDDDTGYDAAAPVIERAMAGVADGTPAGGAAPARVITVRYLLPDLGTVLGTDRVKLRDVVSLLRDLDSRWARYQKLTATQLKSDLEDEGVKVVNTSGVYWLDPADLRSAVAHRQEDAAGGEDDPPW
jgi:DNA segregation ATPase FtsK/SpoIIIE, S-DNA-T family